MNTVDVELVSQSKSMEIFAIPRLIVILRHFFFLASTITDSWWVSVLRVLTLEISEYSKSKHYLDLGGSVVAESRGDYQFAQDNLHLHRPIRMYCDPEKSYQQVASHCLATFRVITGASDDLSLSSQGALCWVYGHLDGCAASQYCPFRKRRERLCVIPRDEIHDLFSGGGVEPPAESRRWAFGTMRISEIWQLTTVHKTQANH